MKGYKYPFYRNQFENYLYIFIVLGVAILLEYKSFSVAFKEFRKASPTGFIKPLKDVNRYKPVCHTCRGFFSADRTDDRSDHYSSFIDKSVF